MCLRRGPRLGLALGGGFGAVLLKAIVGCFR